MKEWHCVLHGLQAGPFDEDRIREKVGRGELSPDTLVWSGSMPEDAAKGWRRMDETELGALFAPPPSPPEILPPAAGAVSRGLELASRKRRLAAFMVGGLIEFLLLLLLAAPQLGSFFWPGGRFVNMPLWVAGTGAALLAWLFYLGYNLYGLHRSGQSVSKKIFGMRIVNLDGSRTPLWRIILLRYGFLIFLDVISGVIVRTNPFLRGPISVLVSTIYLIDRCLIFRKDRRTLRDLIAGTIVVMKR